MRTTHRPGRSVLVRITLAAFLASLAGMAGAQSASHLAAAEAYLEATDMQGRMAALISQVRDRQLEAVQRWYVPKVEQAYAGEYIRRVTALVEAELGWAALEPEFIDAYARVYTEEELRGLIGFYGTALGQAYLRKRASLAGEGFEITQRHLQRLIPKIERLAIERPVTVVGPVIDR